MAKFFAAKTGAELVQRSYTVLVDGDDNPASVTTSASGVTVVSAEIEGKDVLLNLSGGTNGQTATIIATVVTDEGRTLVETLYLPIVASSAQIAEPAVDYVTFAIRKIVGNGETPSADELADGLQRLSAMIAAWREMGADIGAPFPLDASTVIYCPDYAVQALRYNLLVDCASLYGEPVTQMEMMQARRGLALVMNKNMPEVRSDVYY